jgi:hypothetical protein
VKFKDKLAKLNEPLFIEVLENLNLKQYFGELLKEMEGLPNIQIALMRNYFRIQ